MAMRRFRVAEDSMVPALVPGEELVVTDSRNAEIGDVVVLPHPQRESFWLVKRMVKPPAPVGKSKAWVLSDNLEATRADSRTLGPVPAGSLQPIVRHLDHQTFIEACELLAAEDAALKATIETFGIPEFWHREPGLPTLVWLILEQQVSIESGAAMYRRLDAATGGVTAETILALGPEGLRSIGVTRQKSSYLTALASLVLEGSLDVVGLADLGMEEAKERLVTIKGVGPWTAEAYLLSALRHPDVFPVGDRALQVGTAEILGLTGIPDEANLDLLSQPWRPIRAAAARIIWHAYLSERGRTEPQSPPDAHTSSGGA